MHRWIPESQATSDHLGTTGKAARQATPTLIRQEALLNIIQWAQDFVLVSRRQRQAAPLLGLCAVLLEPGLLGGLDVLDGGWKRESGAIEVGNERRELGELLV